MAKFDIISFLDKHNIEYVDSGPNVARGNVNIKCPFCGPNDPSHHMGIEPQSSMWACWRDKNHRGKSPVRLIKALIHCSHEEALRIVGKEGGDIDEDLLHLLAEGSYFKNKEQRSEVPENNFGFAKGVREFNGKYTAETKFKDYLVSRGFEPQDVDSVIRTYKLRYAMLGKFKRRLILPYYNLDHELVTFSGRSLYKSSGLRYKEVNKNEAYIHSKHTLFNLNLAQAGGKVLFVVEGPIDVLKLDFYGRHLGCRSVGLSTVSVSEAQVLLLLNLSKSFEAVRIVVDEGYIAQQQDILDDLSILPNIGISALPKGVEDPGELSKSQVISFCKQELRSVKDGRQRTAKRRSTRTRGGRKEGSNRMQRRVRLLRV